LEADQVKLFLVTLVIIFAILPTRALADTDSDYRYRMLVSAGIDGYPTDDDVTAIGRYLTALGDLPAVRRSLQGPDQLPALIPAAVSIPDDVCSWLLTKLGHMGPTATPRLLNAYMHFLRNGAVLTPFNADAPGTNRNRLLLAIEADLIRTPYPSAELALAMFMESDDPTLRDTAANADYSALRYFPWLLQPPKWEPTPWDFTLDDWAGWISNGVGPVGSPPVYLIKVRKLLSTVNIQPAGYTEPDTYPYLSASAGTNDLGEPSAKPESSNNEFTQTFAVSKLVSQRIASTLGITPISDETLRVFTALGMTAGNPNPYQGGSLAQLYAKEIGFSKTSDRLENLFSALSLQQMRLLALASYALVSFQRSHHGPPVSVGMDQIFNQLGESKLSKAERHTTIVTSLSREEAEDSITDLSTVAACEPKKLEVISRVVSIESRRFVEELQATCAAGAPRRFRFIGDLPTDVGRLLEINSDYLDIISMSLGLQSLAATTTAWRDNPSDVDLIVSNPSRSTALDLAVLAHPDTPWSFVRDYLLEGWPASVEWYTLGWRSAPANSFSYPRADRVVYLSAAEFAEKQQVMLENEKNALQVESAVRFYNDLWDGIYALPEKTYDCGWFGELLSFGGSCGSGGHHTSRDTMLDELNARYTDAVNLIKSNNAWSMIKQDKCIPNAVHDIDDNETWINQATGDFLTQYTTVAGPLPLGCKFAITGPIKFSAPYDLWLQRALDEDPIFLNRYQVSLAKSSDDWQSRLVDALTAAWAEDSVASKALANLQSTNLIFALPSVQAPLADWDNKQQPDADSLLDVMTAPLLRTHDGSDFAADLVSLQMARVSALPILSPNKIGDDFVADIKEKTRGLFTQVDAQADQAAKSVLAQVAATSDVQIYLGVDINGSSVAPGLSFTYRGVGLGFSMPPSQLDIRPVLPDMKFNGLPILDWSDSPPFPDLSPIKFDESPDEGAAGFADSAGFPTQITSAITDVDWTSLLSQGNFAGRTWLLSQITIATPLLTPDEEAQINTGLKELTFPTALAKTVAEKASEVQSRGVASPAETNTTIEASACGGSWSNCAVAIKRELDAASDNTDKTIEIALRWDAIYDKQYEALRNAGHLETSTPDSDVVDAGMEKLFDLATDHAKDAVIKYVLGRYAFVWEWTNSSMFSVITGLFDATSTSTDFDELQLANSSMQETIGTNLEPLLRPDWKVRLSRLVKQTSPEWTTADPLSN
jgi:hypothetical protein